jgi:hypothetical protein
MLDYDIAEITKDKDPWPSIIDVQLERDGRADWDRGQRIREHFRDVTDSDLTQFFPSRTASS